MEVNEPAVKYESFPQMNPAEFIEWESAQPYKHEYVGGKIIAMAGASLRHNKISTNLMRNISPFLSGKECEIYGSDLRVLVKSKESFFYPDATIVCGEVELSDQYKDTIKNPSVIFEILSPATENYDLGKKFFMYMQIESLKEYITVDSASMLVRISRRKDDNSWVFEQYSEGENSFTISSIKYILSLNDVYADVK
jgi:Uma2 family endonuclease